MKDPVRPEDIKRMDELYHLLVRQNISSGATVPDAIKELSPLDISVLNTAASNPDIIIREIAETLNVPNSTLTSSLNRLEKKGLAHRIISSRDRRSFGLAITPKGWDVQKTHLEFEKAYFQSVLARLDTDGERALLLDLLNRIVRSDGRGRKETDENDGLL